MRAFYGVILSMGFIIVIITFIFLGRSYVNDDIEIVFLDVGQGDSMLLQIGRSTQILIDGGKDVDLAQKVANYLPWYDKNIEMIIATHPDADHIEGFISLAQTYQIQEFVYSKSSEGALYQTLIHELEKQHTTFRNIPTGRRLSVKGVTLRMLLPLNNEESENANEHSLVIQLIIKKLRILMTGDATIYNEQQLIRTYGKSLSSDILKVGHHGSKTSTSNALLQTVQPTYAIISAGCNNRYNHPHPSIIKKLETKGSKILDTCSRNDIVFMVSDDDKVYLQP